MKKLIILFLSVFIALASCTEINDITESKVMEDNQITFVANNFGTPKTRAIVDTTAMVDNFGVYGYVVPGTFSENGGYLMKNAEYEETGVAVGGPHYWPMSDNNTGIDFIFTAYSQYTSNPVWENDTLKLEVPTLTQNLIDNADDFNDILWAQTAYNHHQNSLVAHEKVHLNFNHALSWIQFKGTVMTPNIKWVKVKQISFGEYRDSIPGIAAVPEVPYQPAVYDTTDTWINLKRGTNVDGSATKLKGPGESAYTDNAALPAELVNEIKSYYSINNGTPGDYDLHMGNSVWPSAEIRQLRVVKDIPAAYKITVEMYAGVTMDFFNGWKYLKDNGYDIQPRTSGGKPAVWNYVLIDAFVNGTAYTVVGLNYGNSQSAPQYTISEISPEVPYQAGVAAVPGVPATGSDGVYVNGVLCIPTKDTITTTPMAEYTGDKDTTLNYVKADVDTIYTNDVVFLGNSLVIPQPVPENITVVFDMCITNNTGDSVVFTDRKITRVINVNKDMKDLDYVASWNASNKYIYNFNFNGDSLTFSTSVTGWTVDSIHNFHVWDY